MLIPGQRVYRALSGSCRHRTIVSQLNFNCRFLLPKLIMFLLALYPGRVMIYCRDTSQGYMWPESSIGILNEAARYTLVDQPLSGARC